MLPFVTSPGSRLLDAVAVFHATNDMKIDANA